MTNFCFDKKIPLLLGLLLLSFSFPQDRPISFLPLSFKQMDYRVKVFERVFADFDGDGLEEFIETLGNGVSLVDFDGPQLLTACHEAGYRTVHCLRALDITGDASPEIVFAVKNGNKVNVQVWEVNLSFGEINCRLFTQTEPIQGYDLRDDGSWDGSISDIQTVDLNGNGQKDILVAVCTGYDKNPRGVYAYEGKTGKRLWEFQSGGPLYPLTYADVNNNGSPEIIFGTWAPCNVNEFSGIDDCHSYLICLTSTGKLLWKKRMGGKFTHTIYSVDDVDNDGKMEIICTYATGDEADKFTRFELQIREGMSGEIKKFIRLPYRFGKPYLVDLDNNSTKEILVTNQNGSLYVLNTNLEVTTKEQLGNSFKKLNVSQIGDFINDGKKEIMVNMANQLLILNNNLDIIGKYQSTETIVSGYVHFFFHPQYGGLISLIVGNKKEFRICEILKMEKTASLPLDLPVQRTNNYITYAFIFILGAAISLFSIKVVPVFLRNRKYANIKKKEKDRYSLLETLSVFGHGKTASANLDRLSFLFKNLPANHPLSREYRERIDKTINTYFEYTTHRVKEIIRKSYACSLKPGILNTLKKKVQDLEKLLLEVPKWNLKPRAVETLSREIPSLLNSIEEKIDHIQRDISRYYSCDVVSAIEEVLAAVSPKIKEENIKFRNLIIEGDIPVKGFIIKKDFTLVLEELIHNAIYSMKGKNEKEIFIKIKVGEKKIFVDIGDTGSGIKKENIDKIFDLEYSTKKEGGFGLYHTRVTLNKYMGKIKVTQSEPGKGTTMRMEIKRI